MSRDASVTITWADGDYKFRLGIGQIRELQEKCDAGPGHMAGILAQGMYGPWRVDYIREPLRLGLIGGGMEPAKVVPLIKRYVDERPWAENIQPALAVLLASVVGVPDEQLGKSEAASEAGEQPNSPVESTLLPPSTVPAPSSDLPLPK